VDITTRVLEAGAYMNKKFVLSCHRRMIMCVVRSKAKSLGQVSHVPNRVSNSVKKSDEMGRVGDPKDC